MDYIKTGDIVSVNFNNIKYTLTNKAKVLYTPGSAGVGWIFKDIATGDVYDVSEGCTVTRKQGGNHGI